MILKESLRKNFDIQGHRGCRGLFPENTLEAFEKALGLGVTTLEMDLVISKDFKVVVSHEPFFNHEISTTPDGKLIEEAEEKRYNLFQMTYEEIKKYDVGIRTHPRFLQQKKQSAYKPLFEDVINMAESYSQKMNRNIHYNVEIKSTIDGDSIFHPEIPLFTNLVVDIVRKKGIASRTMVQSFDLRALQFIHNNHYDITTSYLIENNLNPEANLEALGFVPNIYSPEYPLVDNHLIKLAKAQSMKIIPWTVNTSEEIKTLIELGVDGIITDYPNLFKLS